MTPHSAEAVVKKLAKEVVAGWDAQFTYKLNISRAGIDLLTQLITEALTTFATEQRREAEQRASKSTEEYHARLMYLVDAIEGIQQAAILQGTGRLYGLDCAQRVGRQELTIAQAETLLRSTTT